MDLARHLHASGTTERIFGRPLPVAVFDMDCPGWEEEATRAANPPHLIEDFLAWYSWTARSPSPAPAVLGS
ncbi:hypothetical protein BM536_034380 [Streptomyces phaeoluteigriseus]|uniref:Uncharacterized protein n=1 Tax=Streptomyces phaeoluteigriseus TaxID=114686 RepID=A0A1V6MLK7_9ACTN|nr:hypothetical protein BM536_034380 [Streptomyces phaeoluteigriseus]